MLYEVDHATFSFKNERGSYLWTHESEKASSDTLTLIHYDVAIGE
jgi:hypothetical protein